MRQAVTALIAIACLAIFAAGSAQAQPPQGATVGFTNKSEVNVIVGGYTIVNNQKRSGPPLPLKAGKQAFENNVPPGVRFYTILDANFQQIGSGQVIIRGGNVVLEIVPSRTNPKLLVIVPAGG